MKPIALAATLMMGLAAPAFAQVTTVTPDPAPSGQAQGPAPFTYRGTTGARTQQVYSSDFFSTSQTITSIAFRSTPFFMNAATYDNVIIKLSTTSFGDENGAPLSSTFSDNIGADVTTVYSGLLSFAAPLTGGFEYIVNLTTGFNYDPTAGNLLLDVLIPNGTNVSGPGFFLASYDTANTIGDGVYSVNSVFDGNAVAGISNTAAAITQFTGSPIAAAVPEPSTWAMMLIGFAGLGLVANRRRSAASAV